MSIEELREELRQQLVEDDGYTDEEAERMVVGLTEEDIQDIMTPTPSVELTYFVP
jgi:Ni2+-binding GTPase involved in maturation of urease and hydrogenase